MHDFSISQPWLCPIEAGGGQSSSLYFTLNKKTKQKNFISISKWSKSKRSWQVIKDCNCHQYFTQNLGFCGDEPDLDFFYVYANVTFCSC